MIDHQIQSFDENLTTHDPIDNESCLRKQPTWMIDYISRDDLSDDDQIVHDSCPIGVSADLCSAGAP